MIGPRTKVAIALAVGAALVAFKVATGHAAPSETDTGAAIYWLSFALGLPAIAAGLAWMFRYKDPSRSSIAASTFLWWTIILNAILLAADLVGAGVA